MYYIISVVWLPSAGEEVLHRGLRAAAGPEAGAEGGRGGATT